MKRSIPWKPIVGSRQLRRRIKRVFDKHQAEQVIEIGPISSAAWGNSAKV